MNVREKFNLLSDIPGFDASKGERINKALQRLWAKIEYLEQIRLSERKTLPKDNQTNSNEEERNVTDIQFMLLVLQLRYARSILKKKLNNTGVNEGIVDQAEFRDKKNDRDNIKTIAKMSAIQTVCQETQTGNSLIEEVDPHMKELDQNLHASTDQTTSDDAQYQFDDGHQSGFSSSRAEFQSFLNSKPHYHLRLDDIPFILGASSSASHSVVANLQSIIAMMKTHNKALCGPRYEKKIPASKLHIPEENSQETAKLFNKLAQDLHELAQKQKKLDQQFDSAQRKSNTISNKDDNDHDKEACSTAGQKQNSVSSKMAKIHAETNVKDASHIQGQRIAAKTRSGSQSLARRKLLRSLQNFKSHLSEEDISWK